MNNLKNINEGILKLGDLKIYAQNINYKDPQRHEPFISVNEKTYQVQISPEPATVEFGTALTKNNPKRINYFESLNGKTILATSSSDFLRAMYVVLQWEYDIDGDSPSHAKYTVNLEEDTNKEIPIENLEKPVTTNTKKTTLTSAKPKGYGKGWIRWGGIS